MSVGPSTGGFGFVLCKAKCATLTVFEPFRAVTGMGRLRARWRRPPRSPRAMRSEQPRLKRASTPSASRHGRPRPPLAFLRYAGEQLVALLREHLELALASTGRKQGGAGARTGSHDR